MLEHFTNKDIKKAAELTFSAWGSELPEENEGIKSFIYEALVRYYYKNFRFSYKITEQKLLQAFLLAGKLEDKTTFSQWFAEGCNQFNAYDSQIAKDYLAYLMYNSEVMKHYASANDLLLLLFLSKLPGAGSRLLANAEQQARGAGLKRMFLWADCTCDYDYYYKKGFQETAVFINDKMSRLGRQKTIIFCKNLSEKPND